MSLNSATVDGTDRESALINLDLRTMLTNIFTFRYELRLPNINVKMLIIAKTIINQIIKIEVIQMKNK